MRIAIIGAGHVGQALAPAWLKRGHEVRFGVPNPADAKYRGLAAPAARPQEAAVEAEAIVLATPWHATEAAIRSLGDIAGRIVIDCTNPLGMGPDGLGLVLGHDSSGGEKVAEWAQGAAVFKAFNTTGAANLADPSRYRPPPIMFVAGDDAARKPQVMNLVRESGFEPRDVGPLKLARLLEPFALPWIDQSLNRGAGSDFVFTVQHKA